jgi:hypothetical protein
MICQRNAPFLLALATMGGTTQIGSFLFAKESKEGGSCRNAEGILRKNFANVQKP